MKTNGYPSEIMKRNTFLLVAGSFLCVALTVSATTRYVNLNNHASDSQFTSWAAAATNIQDAIDVAVAGDDILVTNGVYQTGARDVYGMSNRVAVTQAVTVRSVNGPAVTSIVGSGPKGPVAVRCVYLTNGAVLAGFTLTNGATQSSGDMFTNQSGGGVWCESLSGVVSNCVLTGNSAFYGGGGAYYGTLYNCTLTGNLAEEGGGAYSATLNNCAVTGNSASFVGGGAIAGELNSCVLKANSAMYGGGANNGTVKNCTLTGNSASSAGGGAYGGMLYNCILYYNTAPSGANYASGTIIYYCSTTPLPPSGSGNFTNAPLFTDTNGWGNLRLKADSPCINAGNNVYASDPSATDLDGNPRTSGDIVDIGAYEYQFTAPLHTWLAQYGLPTDGSSDYTDTDHDGLNNWQEWVAGTNPTNAASVLRLNPPLVTPPGWQLRWSSDSGQAYFVERATNLAGPLSFRLVRADIPGLPGVTAYTDTTAPALGAVFYRVGTGSSSTTPPSLQVPVFVPASVTLTWSSVSYRSYTLERATNLGALPAFSVLQSNLAGWPTSTSWIDTNSPGSAPRLYRVRVEN